MFSGITAKFKNRRVRGDWRSLKGWRPYFLIAAIGFLLYSQTLFFGFSYFDDNALVIDNQEILSSVHNIGRIFSDDVFFSAPQNKFYYRPFLNLSLMLDAQLGKLNAGTGTLTFFFHFSNILWHLLAASLVFYLLKRLWKKRTLAFIMSLFFLVHPALAPAVAWIPGRNDSLLAIFVLTAFLSFLNFLKKPGLRSYLAYLILFFCGLLTKESAIGLPLVVIFYFWFVEKDKIARYDKLALIIGSGSVIFVWLLMRRLALGPSLSGHLAGVPAVWHNLPALFIFAGKLILPFDLSVLPTLANGRFIWGILGLSGFLALGLIFPPRRPRRFLLGIFWLFIFLLPTFLNPDTSSGFLSHRLYLSFFGFLLILGEFEWTNPPLLFRHRYFLIISGILAFLAILSIIHSRSFRDRLVFWQTAAAYSPLSALAQRNLGAMYYLNGQPALAEEYYLRALRLSPDEIMVHNNLGVIYMDRGLYNQARTEFYRELEINPAYDKALNNLIFLQNRLK